MISCIICSHHSDISSKLKDNILKTIGVECELVVIDNSNNSHSIFSAYNEGVRRAKGDILCFMHDDIEYVTQNWGNVVQTEMNNYSVGCIGVAGTYFMPNYPTAWWNTFANIGQWIYQDSEGNRTYHNLNEGIINDIVIPAVVVDGFWMCIKSSLFNEISFDEMTYNGGFHCYDIDICMQIHSIHKEVRVLSDLWIAHYSTGNITGDFHEKLELWYKKWNNFLPMCTLNDKWGGKYAIDRNILLKRIFNLIVENMQYKQQFFNKDN